MNMLSAKIVKAEIMGDAVLVCELKAKLEAARKLKEWNGSEAQEVILTETSAKGRDIRLKCFGLSYSLNQLVVEQTDDVLG